MLDSDDLPEDEDNEEERLRRFLAANEIVFAVCSFHHCRLLLVFFIVAF